MAPPREALTRRQALYRMPQGRETVKGEKEVRDSASAVDLVGESYWNREWAGRSLRRALDLRNYVHARFDSFFRRQLCGVAGDLLEIGCAGSLWLPYFHQRFGLRVFGIDYSPLGCRQAEEVLAAHGVAGTIWCRDIFAPNEDLRSRFQVVFSYGVAEHFSPPEALLARARDLCAPGGIVLTVIPNMTGLPGLVQRVVDRDVFHRHVPLNLSELGSAHRACGLTLREATPLGSFSWGVVKYPPRGLWPRTIRRLYKIGSLLAWRVFRITGWRPETAWFSPYFVCAAAVPCDLR